MLMMQGVFKAKIAMGVLAVPKAKLFHGREGTWRAGVEEEGMEGHTTKTTQQSTATSRLILAAASVLGSWVSASACAGGSGSGAAAVCVDGVCAAARSNLVGEEEERLEPYYVNFSLKMLRLTHVVALQMVLCLGDAPIVS